MTLRDLRHALEGAVLELVLVLFRALPLDRASALGGWVGRTVGPRLEAHRVAQENLRCAFPEMDAAGRAGVIRRMWDNLGRVVAELAHLDRIYPEGRVEIVGDEHIAALHDSEKGGIFFSAHFGNWELLSVSLARRDIAPVFVYRPANSPASERAIQRRRHTAHDVEGTEYVPKSAEGMRRLVKALGQGRCLAMLVDQKLNEGIPVPFFGRDAMTAPAIARMALRYKVPLVPARIERLGGAHFRLTVFPPMTLPDTGDAEADVHATMAQIHGLFEEWIRARPDHWLWIHRRWPAEG